MTTEANWSDFGNFDADRAIAAANRVLPRWVALALVVGIAWQLARLIWMLLPGADIDEPVIAPPVQISRSAPAGGQTIDAQAIADVHLFGEADAAPVEAPPQENLENLAETRLNLSLKGTIASPDPANAIAIIADARNEEKIYSVRDTVAPGATLHAIYADRVVLNRGGSLEVLKLPKEFPQGSAPIRRTATTVSRTATTADNSQSIQNVVSQNVTQLADVIRPTPYFVSGQMQGYRVYPGRDRRQFAALGLRPGDLIKDIDGQSLTNPQQATQIFQNLGDKAQVSVTVERNGQAEVLTLNTDQLELGML